jgi:uncharacterized protein (DUF362 family)
MIKKRPDTTCVSRRRFMKTAAVTAAGLSLPFAGCDTGSGGGENGPGETDDAGSDPIQDQVGVTGTSKVFVVKADDREAGLEALLEMTDLSFAEGRDVTLKPNFNSSQPFPGSTHDDTIRGVSVGLKAAGCGSIALSESSGPSGTANVIGQKGTLGLCDELGIQFVNFDNLPDAEWESFEFDGMSWPSPLAIPKVMRDDHAVVLLPCCKTHQFGGHFTMALKLAVGLIKRPRRMSMHRSPNIRALVAEINMGFAVDLVVMDALSCFVSGGPDTGKTEHPGLLLASADRVAIDAVGLAVLARAGSAVTANKKIFGQDQIVRAAELGLGAGAPDQIELIGDDTAVLSDLRAILDEG